MVLVTTSDHLALARSWGEWMALGVLLVLARLGAAANIVLASLGNTNFRDVRGH